MEIRVSRDTLAPALSQVSRYAAKNSTKPTLNGILVETVKTDTKTFLRLTASDGAIVGKAMVPVESADEGTFLVPSDFAELVRSLRGATVELSVKDGVLGIKSGRGAYNLNLIDGAYPELPGMPATTGTIDSVLFASAVSQVARAASKDMEQLSGVYVEIKKDAVTIAATDRYRMAVRRLKWTGTDSDVVGYVPSRILSDAVRQFGRSGELRIAVDAEAMSFGIASGQAAVMGKQVEEQFPPYEKLLPKAFAATATVKVSELIEALKPVSLFGATSQNQTVVNLSFSKGKLNIKASTAGKGNGGEDMDVDYDGDDIVLAVNPTYLSDGLGALESETATFGIIDSKKPLTIKSSGSDDFTYLLMPVRV